MKRDPRFGLLDAALLLAYAAAIIVVSLDVAYWRP